MEDFKKVLDNVMIESETLIYIRYNGKVMDFGGVRTFISKEAAETRIGTAIIQSLRYSQSRREVLNLCFLKELEIKENQYDEKPFRAKVRQMVKQAIEEGIILLEEL